MSRGATRTRLKLCLANSGPAGSPRTAPEPRPAYWGPLQLPAHTPVPPLSALSIGLILFPAPTTLLLGHPTPTFWILPSLPRLGPQSVLGPPPTHPEAGPRPRCSPLRGGMGLRTAGSAFTQRVTNCTDPTAQTRSQPVVRLSGDSPILVPLIPLVQESVLTKA